MHVSNHFNDKIAVKLTPVNGPVNIVHVRPPSTTANATFTTGSIPMGPICLYLNPVQRSLILKLHTNTNVGILDERAVK